MARKKKDSLTHDVRPTVVDEQRQREAIEIQKRLYALSAKERDAAEDAEFHSLVDKLASLGVFG